MMKALDAAVRDAQLALKECHAAHDKVAPDAT
jgi:hypothetical protein